MTRIIKMKSENLNIELLKEVGAVLADGGLVAFPTETVYGLGANALDDVAVSKIYIAKGRPSDNPLIVHVSEAKAVESLAETISAKARLLMDAFWPGPLTLIFKKKNVVPDGVTGGLDTVAIRMPSHVLAKELIRLSGVPVAAPSANVSGRPSPTKGEHVVQDLAGRVDVIIDGDDCIVGLESTVLDVSGDVPMILRPGGVTKEMLEAVVGAVEIDPAIQAEMDSSVVPKSPGMKYRHYAPDADMLLLNGSPEAILSYIKTVGEKAIGLLLLDETIEFIADDLDMNDYNVKSLGSREDLSEGANRLFDALRSFDAEGCRLILSEAPNESGIGLALYNRMKKACGNQVIKLD